jgi:twinkle protein
MSLGTTTAPKTGAKIVALHQPCPVCPSSDAYCEYDDGHGYCYSCQYFKGSKELVLDDTCTYEYLAHRGLTKETLRFYDIRTKIDKDGKPIEDGFVYPDKAVKIRSLEEKSFKWAKDGQLGADTSKTGLFGRDKFNSGGSKYVIITEGEYDAATFYQVLGHPSVSVQSSGVGKRDCSVDHGWLSGFERVYLAFDNDAAGRECLRSVARLFDYNRVFVIRFDTRKDANDYLQHGDQQELKNLFANARRYLPESIISTFQEFGQIIGEQPREGKPYPFKTLNELTYGIRRGESVLFTAQEGVGKTEIMHSIEYKLLKETDENVGAIFIEEPKRRHLQALAGLELKKPVHLPDCSSSHEEVIGALQSVVGRDDRLHVYSHFGSDDPEVILDTIRFLVTARSCVYILFDHISMAVSGLAGEDERRALDFLSTRLEMMVKELDFSLIFVSHVNDFGQTRGSRYISKVADIRVDLQRDLTNPDPAVRNITNLTVSKNRFSGKTGPAGKLRFDPHTYVLDEIFEFEGANDNRPFELVGKQFA